MFKIMSDITKEQFARFCRLQSSGAFNMTDIARGSKMVGVTEEEYEDILFNYSELETKFERQN